MTQTDKAVDQVLNFISKICGAIVAIIAFLIIVTILTIAFSIFIAVLVFNSVAVTLNPY